MKADNKDDMLALAIDKLKAEDAAPFPLYVFLKKNDRYVPIRRPGDPIGQNKYDEFIKKHLKELYVPKSFQEAVGRLGLKYRYLAFNARGRNRGQAVIQIL